MASRLSKETRTQVVNHHHWFEFDCAMSGNSGVISSVQQRGPITMTAQAEDSLNLASNKENSNLVSNSTKATSVDSIHKDLLLETLFLLQHASRDTIIPPMSLHTVQTLIQSILENNLHGVHSIITAASSHGSETTPINSDADDRKHDDDEQFIVKALAESHITDQDRLIGDDGGGIDDIHQEESNLWTFQKQHSPKLLLGPLNHKIGGTTGVVLELDIHDDNGTSTSPATTNNTSSFTEQSKGNNSSRRAECLVRILSSSGTYPETSAHEAIVNETSSSSPSETSYDDDREGSSESISSNEISTRRRRGNVRSSLEIYPINPDMVEEAVDVGSLPRQGYIMMRFLCAHMLPLDDDDRRPPPPPPSPYSSSIKSLSLNFQHSRLPEIGERCGTQSNNHDDDDGLGYTKWTLTKEEIEVIEQEYEWFVQFYSIHETEEDHQVFTSGSRPSEKLYASLCTHDISTGDCNLSDDLEEDCLFVAGKFSSKPSINVSLIDHWIDGVNDNDIAEDEPEMEFFRLGASHGDLHNYDTDDEDDDNSDFCYGSIKEAKEESGRNCILPQDSSCLYHKQQDIADDVADCEVFAEFHLPVVYKPYKTGLEPSPELNLIEGDMVAGRYRVVSELGRAAFSVAYRCVDLLHDTPGNPNVCLKVIQNSKDFLDQSLDEIKVLQLLQNGHDGKNLSLSSSTVCDRHHILHLRCYFYFKEHLILVTELLEDNLYEFDCKIRQHTDSLRYFNMQRLSYISRQILMALTYVHSLGLIHSDLKPENLVMWSHPTAKVKLIDFGSACFTTDHLSSYVQSRSYRAPEVVLGLPYGPKIDVWSLGCVVAELFTGQVLFQNESIIEMLARIEATRGVFPRHMISKGSKSGDYFLSSGLLYSEHVKEENGTSVALYDIYRPDISSLEESLGLDLTKTDKVETLFLDFVGHLLTLDPENRPTSEEALSHPWILWGTSLTEDDVKYPSS